jgi:hypothetical protein
MSEYLVEYLNDRGNVPGIGPERGVKRFNGISRYTSPHGSYRYVMYVNGTPVSALQVVSRDGVHAKIANVYTVPAERRKRFAETLLMKARTDFNTVEHADPEMLTSTGKRWRDTVKENPIDRYWYWIGAGAAVIGTYAIWQYLNATAQAKLESSVPPGVPLTFQPTDETDLYVVPTSRENVMLSLSSTNKMLNYINLHFAPNGQLSSSDTTAISIDPTATGAKVTALALGGAVITINYDDPSGKSDAIIGVSVYE